MTVLSTTQDTPMLLSAAEVGAHDLLGGGVAVPERHVLHDQARPLLVEAVRGGDPPLRVARVHVQDPPDAAPAERHHPATVQDDPRAGVADLRCGLHGDGHRARAAGEGDHTTCGDGRDDGL
jgi:hypothetical protein